MRKRMVVPTGMQNTAPTEGRTHFRFPAARNLPCLACHWLRMIPHSPSQNKPRFKFCMAGSRGRCKARAGGLAGAGRFARSVPAAETTETAETTGTARIAPGTCLAPRAVMVSAISYEPKSHFNASDILHSMGKNWHSMGKNWSVQCSRSCAAKMAAFPVRSDIPCGRNKLRPSRSAAR